MKTPAQIAESIARVYLSIEDPELYEVSIARIAQEKPSGEATCRIRFIKNSKNNLVSNWPIHLDQFLELKHGHHDTLTLDGAKIQDFVCAHVTAAHSGDGSGYFSFLKRDGIILSELTQQDREYLALLKQILDCNPGSPWKYEDRVNNSRRLRDVYFPHLDPSIQAHEEMTSEARAHQLLRAPVLMWPSVARLLAEAEGKRFGWCAEVAHQAARDYAEVIEGRSVALPHHKAGDRVRALLETLAKEQTPEQEDSDSGSDRPKF